MPVAVKNMKRGASQLLIRVVDFGRHATAVGRFRVGDTNLGWKDHRVLLLLLLVKDKQLEEIFLYAL